MYRVVWGQCCFKVADNYPWGYRVNSWGETVLELRCRHSCGTPWVPCGSYCVTNLASWDTPGFLLKFMYWTLMHIWGNSVLLLLLFSFDDLSVLALDKYLYATFIVWFTTLRTGSHINNYAHRLVCVFYGFYFGNSGALKLTCWRSYIFLCTSLCMSCNN